MENYDQTQNAEFTVLGSSVHSQEASKTFVANVFMWMFVGLLASAVTAYLFAFSGFRDLILQATSKGVRWTTFGSVMGFLPLIFFFVIAFGLQRMSYPALVVLFLSYAVTMGISLFSIILLVYQTASVVTIFAASAAMFGVMAVLGYTTNQDLTSFGRILMMALIGIIIAAIINVFIHSTALNTIISMVGVAVFTGLTAYDVQKIKRIGAGIEYQGISANDTKKLAILGAFNLYLDFINLFIMLINLFGKRND
jgi:FtsH-binding integral membrane protein